ncbi:MAG: AI-2E family transporter [Bacteroidetes bacterium]|nr:AI-2E family transporter [Bacteroidota bacterium]
MEQEEYNKKFARRFVIVSLLICLILFYSTLSIFLDGFLGAIILYFLFMPLMLRLVEVKKWKKGLAATTILIISFFIIFVPVYFIGSLILPRIYMIFSSGSLTMDALQKADNQLQNLIGFQVLTPENLASLQSSATGFITKFLGASLNILTDLLLLYLFFYYLLVNTGKIEKYLGEIIPFSPDKMDRFSKELEAQTKSNALGIPLLAICQGLFASLGYWIFGIPEPFFWGLMTGFFSLLPMVGSALIWVPAGLYKLSEGSNWQGIAIILYGILLIGMVDNVFRLVFQKKFADIHPMVTILGVIIGLQLFGVPGLIFGPLLIGYFILLLKIFKEEFLKI